MSGLRAEPAVSLLAAALGVAVGLLVVAWAGASPGEALRILVAESLAPSRFADRTLTAAIPLALAALGACIAFRAGLFNLGGEGQLLVAALVADVIAVQLSGLAVWAAVPLATLGALAAAGLVAGFAGLLRVRRRVSEIVSTIMLNVILVGLVAALVRGPLLAPGAAFPQTHRTPPDFDRPSLWGVDAWLPLVIVLAMGLAVWLTRARGGLRLRATGDNPIAASIAGIAIGRIRIAAMTASGMLMGLAGVYELFAVQHRVSPGFSPGYGFSGLLVLFLGGGGPIGILPAALFVAVLETGGPALSRQLGVPAATILVMQGTAALLAVGLPWLVAARRRGRHRA